MSMDNSGALVINQDGTAVDPVKPGIQTSEFWVAVATGIATLVVSILALFGHVVKTDNLKPIIGAVGILGPIVVSAYYSQSRGNVKAAAHAAAASIVAARLYQPQMLEASPLLSAPAPVVHVHLTEAPAAAPSASVEPTPEPAAPPAEAAAPAAEPDVPAAEPDVPAVPMAEETGAGN